jgi:hypothetical protein
LRGEIEERGGGDVLTSLTTSDAEIAPQPPPEGCGRDEAIRFVAPPPRCPSIASSARLAAGAAAPIAGDVAEDGDDVVVERAPLRRLIILFNEIDEKIGSPTELRTSEACTRTLRYVPLTCSIRLLMRYELTLSWRRRRFIGAHE